MDTISLDVLRFTPVSLQHPPPWVGHIPFAAWLSWRFCPKCFVELGTHWGNSYFAFCQALKQAQISVAAYAVDTWKGDEQTYFYPEEVFDFVSRHNAEHYAEFSSLLRTTFDEAVGGFSDGSIDLLHIDGCHTYEAVKHDFETWLPKLAPGAVVLFHDTNIHDEGYGVWKFWEELKGMYVRTFNFLHSSGLGVLQMEGGDPRKSLPLFFLGAEKQQEFRDAFAALGKTHLYRCRQDWLQKEMARLTRDISIKDVGLIEQDTLLKEKDRILAEQGQVLAEHERLFAYKDAVITEQERVLAEREAAMIHQSGVIAEKDAALTEKEAALLQKEHALAEKDRILTDQGTMLAEHERLFAYKDAVIAEKERRLAETHAAVAHLENTLHGVLNSRSWRLTSPLRAMISFLKKPVLK